MAALIAAELLGAEIVLPHCVVMFGIPPVTPPFAQTVFGTAVEPPACRAAAIGFVPCAWRMAGAASMQINRDSCFMDYRSPIRLSASQGPFRNAPRFKLFKVLMLGGLND